MIFKRTSSSTHHKPGSRLSIVYRTIYILFCVLYFSATFAGQTHAAISQKEFDAISGGYPYYDPDSTDAATCTTSVPSGNTSQNKGTIYTYLTGKGLSGAQAAGVMGNMQAESGFDPARVEGGTGIGYGLSQWSFGRRSALEASAQQKGVAVSDLAFQLDYLYTESNQRKGRDDRNLIEWVGLTQQTTVEDATNFWQWNNERPLVLNTATRIGFARTIYNEFGGATAQASSPGTQTASTGTCGSSAGPVDVIQKISFNDAKTIKPTALILHWWGGGGGIDSLISTLNTRKLSVQIATTADGKVYQLTPQLNSFAEHAKCANDWAIGNEIEGGVNFGPDPGGSGKTVALDLAGNNVQFQAVVKITGQLMKQFNIPLEGEIAQNGSTGVGVHSHKEVDTFCSNGSGKADVDDVYLKRVKDELRKQGF